MRLCLIISDVKLSNNRPCNWHNSHNYLSDICSFTHILIFENWIFQRSVLSDVILIVTSLSLLLSSTHPAWINSLRIFQQESLSCFSHILYYNALWTRIHCVHFIFQLQSFLIYAAGLYGNMGNYKSFGDTKFIPNVTKVTILEFSVTHSIGSFSECINSS